MLLVIAATASTDAPEQPLQFSHKSDAGSMKPVCKMCHPNPDPGATGGDTGGLGLHAMLFCHQNRPPCNPETDSLFPETNGRFAWVRVYEIPDYVIFTIATASKRAMSVRIVTKRWRTAANCLARPIFRWAAARTLYLLP